MNTIFKTKPAEAMRQKIKNKNGFSFTEYLVTIILFALVVAFLAVGIKSAFGAYSDSLFESESQVLISTVNTELADLLRYSDAIETDDENNVTSLTNLQSFETGGVNYYKFGLSGGTVFISDADDNEGLLVFGSPSNETVLVNKGIYKEMAISDFSMKYDETDGIFTVSYKVNSKAEGIIKDSGEIKIAALKGLYN